MGLDSIKVSVKKLAYIKFFTFASLKKPDKVLNLTRTRKSEKKYHILMISNDKSCRRGFY